MKLCCVGTDYSFYVAWYCTTKNIQALSHVFELSLPALLLVLAYCEDGLDELRHIGSVFVSPEINVGQDVALAEHYCLFRLL